MQTRFLGTELRDKDGVVGIQPEDHERDRDRVECQHEEHCRGAHEDRSLCTHTALARALCCVKSFADTGARLGHTGHCMRDEHPGTGHKQQHQQSSNVNSSRHHVGQGKQRTVTYASCQGTSCTESDVHSSPRIEIAECVAAVGIRTASVSGRHSPCFAAARIAAWCSAASLFLSLDRCRPATP